MHVEMINRRALLPASLVTLPHTWAKYEIVWPKLRKKKEMVLGEIGMRTDVVAKWGGVKKKTEGQFFRKYFEYG